MTDAQIDAMLLELNKKAESVDCLFGLPIFSEPLKSELREIVKRHIDRADVEEQKETTKILVEAGLI